jgi:hypothetical protein
MLKRKRRSGYWVSLIVLAGSDMTVFRRCIYDVGCFYAIAVRAMLLSILPLSITFAEDAANFYTVIDQDGHMRSIQKKPVDADRSQSTPVVPTSTASPISTLDGQEYIDSEYLEKRQFNLAGKKTFVTLPDGLGGTQVIERTPGAVETSDAAKNRVPSRADVLFTLSKQYERIPAAEITSLIGMRCVARDALRESKILRDQELILWPRSDAPRLKNRQGLNFLIVELGLNNRDISLQSFAPLGKQSDYYWPLPIFLDEQGCVLEGVNAFYQKTLASSMLQPSVLVGNLHVPEHAKYLMLTPLFEATDLPNIALSQLGQLRLIPLR